MTEEFRQCRRSSRCRETLPVSQLTFENGKWVCEVGRCPRHCSIQDETGYVVEKRYLNVAKIMFLSSENHENDPEEIANNFLARLEEITEEIVDLEVTVHALNGGYIGHAIEGTELIPKRKSKNNFRRAIFDHWDNKCAYCGDPADTLDHVLPRHKGGLTVRENLVSCCRRCNGSKGAEYVFDWWLTKPFFDEERADKLIEWIKQKDQ